MKIYIAGSITNDPNYKEHFKKVEEKIRKIGHVPLNPCKNLGFEYKEYIDMGLNELMQCDAIVLLDDWENSDGAKLERCYATTVRLSIYSECFLNHLLEEHEEYENTKHTSNEEKQIPLDLYCYDCECRLVTNHKNDVCKKYNSYLKKVGEVKNEKCDECLVALRRAIANGTYDEQIKNTMIESENIV